MDTLKLPLWKDLADELIQSGLTYGQQWPAEFFENRLKCIRTEPRFAWEMISLRKHIEQDTGYYIRSSENGKLWSIPQPLGHEDVATMMETKLRRYAGRTVALRSALLTNPSADLSEKDRSTIEKRLEISAHRLILINRTKAIAEAVQKHAPKLLNGKSKTTTP